MIRRTSFLPRLDFITEHLNARRPIILTGIMSQWLAMHTWTDPEYLKAKLGNQMVEVMGERDKDPLYELNCNDHRRQMPWDQFIDYTFSAYGNAVYLVANNMLFSTPAGRALLDDVPAPPEYFYPTAPGSTHLWLGPAGTVTPLHRDSCDILLCQVVGAKRLCMISPAQQHLLYNRIGVFSDVDYERPDLTQYPLFGQIVAEEIFLNAGEALFIPEGWFHHVKSLTPSISVSFTNFIR